jgi:plasmid rolling circle replication initiator protein Rep
MNISQYINKDIKDVSKLELEDLQLAESLKKITLHKLIAEKINIAKMLEQTNRIERIEVCGSMLKFLKERNVVSEEIRRRLVKANFCKYRFCPMCQWRKARKVCREVLGRLRTIEESHNGVALLFLTLTIKNEPLTELNRTIKHLSQAFQRLQQSKQYKDAVLGSIRAIEFLGDNTEQGECHPHFHCLLVVRKSYFKKSDYINFEEWTSLWQRSLRVDYRPIINVQRVKPKGKMSAIVAAALEVVKYSVTSSDLEKLTKEDFQELDKQTRNIRQYNYSGELKDAEPTFDDIEDESLWELLEEEYYQWKNGQYSKREFNRTV